MYKNSKDQALINNKSGLTVQNRETAQFSQLKDAIKRGTVTALKRFRIVGWVQIGLALITIIIGAALVAVTAPNAGLPVFNAGPLVAGILEFAAGVIALVAARRTVRKDDTNTKIKVLIRVHFGLNTLVFIVAGVSLVISAMAAALCAGWDNQFYYIEGGIRYTHDYETYCVPDKDAKIALAALSAVVCGVVFLCNCYAVCLYCAYGSLFGLAYLRH